MIIDAVTITLSREDLERLLAATEQHAETLRKQGNGTTRLAEQRRAHADRLDTTAHNLLTAINQADTTKDALDELGNLSL
jgi:hypothetical protein